MTTIEDISKLINKFYLDSEKEGMALRPNALLVTEEQFDDLLDEMDIDDFEGVRIESILGLDVIIAEGLESPRVIRL